MRCVTKVMAALGVAPVMLTQKPASALPYDPYPWWLSMRLVWAHKFAVSLHGTNIWLL